MDKIERNKILYFLTQVPTLGNVRIKKLIDEVSDLSNILDSDYILKLRIEGLNMDNIKRIRESYNRWDEIEENYSILLERCKFKGINFISIIDDEYPENLRNIYDAPIFLYYKGELKPIDKYSLCMVGTRFPSEYGESVCKQLVKEICSYDIITVSGMAKGIDSMCHRYTLQNGGWTYAVLGSGVDVVYPAENKKLYAEIIENGAVISEFEPGTKPDKVNFPKRNRILSGISLGTIIVETGLRGGSRITAEFALDQDRELFAVPGYIYAKRSQGCNDLIKRGQAKLITCFDDVLSELSYRLSDFIPSKKEASQPVTQLELSVFEQQIYGVIDDNPIHIDEIANRTELSISDCLVNLLTLEFKGLVKQLPGKFFRRDA